MSIREGKLIYHLTPLDSLESIIKNGLMSRDSLEKINVEFIDTADHDILHDRERLGLSNYIPFHFHYHTAYDTAVKNNHIDKKFVYICLRRDYARNNNFLIIPIHPASNEQPELFKYDEGFEKIDWDTMEMNNLQAKDNGVESRYHKQVRMAESLAVSTISPEDFQSINVPNEEVKNYVENLLNIYNVQRRPHINVRNWFVNS